MPAGNEDDLARTHDIVEGGDWRVDLQAITVPLLRSLLAPLRKVRVTGPSVVGVHSTFVAWPAVIMKPSGTLKGFGLLPEFVCAATLVTIQARREIDAKSIVLEGGYSTRLIAIWRIKGINVLI